MSSNKQDSGRNYLKKLCGSIVALAAAPLPGLAAGKKVEERILAFDVAPPCLACKDSYFEKKIIYRNPDDIKGIKA
jgi:hypothetical protein